MTTSALTEKTEAVIKGLVHRSQREQAAGLRPAFTAPAPAAAPVEAPAAIPPAVTDSRVAPHPTRSEEAVATVPVQTLVEAPHTPWIKTDKEAVKLTRLSCHRFRANEVRLRLRGIAYNLGNLSGSPNILPRLVDVTHLS